MVPARFAVHAACANARRFAQSCCAALRWIAVEVLDFERDPALDTATLPILRPGRHFTVANLTYGSARRQFQPRRGENHR
jgi:hypothetical protein